MPVQFSILLVAIAAYWVLLHRSAIGRTLYVIGFSPGGARYAGIPVQRRVALLYFLSGVVSSVAAIIYVAHLGQAKSDAGTGYELAAITAVVLGGTQRLRRARHGLGHGARAVCDFGVAERAAAGGAALRNDGRADGRGAGVDDRAGAPARARGRATQATIEEADAMKNSQLAILCCAVVGGSLIVAGTNVWLVRSLRPADIAPAKGGARSRASGR